MKDTEFLAVLKVINTKHNLNRSRSKFYKEIKRNIGQCGYRPKQTHQLTQSRRYVQTSRLTPFV